MSWIATVPFGAATGRLRQLYDRVAGPGGNVDNIMMAHSLRPHSMEGHMALYKNVLHHSGNTLPEWVLELVGVWVSALNSCSYCVEHHHAGLRRLLGDDARAAELRAAIDRAAAAPGSADSIFEAVADARLRAMLAYAAQLTTAPASVSEAGIARLRAAGLDDGQILELNQVAAYFAYANRTVLGLGCSTEGDVLGLSPGNAEDPEDWGHR